MTSLAVSLRSTEGVHVPYGAVVTISRLRNADGRRSEEPWSQSYAQDIGAKHMEPQRSYELPSPGAYDVTVRFPQGIETAEIDVAQHALVTFELQTISGASDFDDKSSDIAPTTANRLVKPYSASGSRNNPRPFVGTIVPVQALNYEGLQGGGKTQPDDRASVDFRFSSTGTCSIPVPDDAQTLNTILDDLGYHNQFIVPSMNVPRWLKIRHGGGRFLASVPWGWAATYDHEPLVIELNTTFDANRNPRGLVVGVSDRKWRGLMDYASVGLMSEAALLTRSLVDEHQLTDALYGKRKGPLIATFAALVLVQNTLEYGDVEWDPWLHNLADWFPGIPDGAAILGYRLLQKGYFDMASRMLAMSVDRGLPFFSATLRLLSYGFAQLGDDVSVTRIKVASSTVDPSQPFAVFRLRDV